MPHHLGLHHLALFCQDLRSSLQFYTDILGMTIEWQPDSDNVYLTSGNDNLALHQAQAPRAKNQALDHLGFIVASPEEVHAWHQKMKEHNVQPLSPVKAHRDGAHSFYCQDPDGNSIQMIYHPPISPKLAAIEIMR